MEFKKLTVNALKSKLLILNIFLLFCLLIPGVIICFVTNLFLILIVPIILIIVFNIITYLQYKVYEYGYDDLRICIRRGVIFKRQELMPICQIQDLHLYQGPIMCIFKLKNVEISTAGSNYGINLIDANLAEKIVNDLETKLNKRIEEINCEKVL